MEQAQGARDREQAGAWVEAPVAGNEEVADKVKEVALRQDRVVIAFAPIAGKRLPIS